MRLTQDDLVEFQNRFWSFSDGVVREVLLRVSHPRSCVISVECKDRDSQTGWATVVFAVEAVRKFRFELGRTSFAVLSSGMQFAWRQDEVFVVLDAYPDDPGDLPDLSKNTAFVSGRSCDWSVSACEPGLTAEEA